MIRLQLSELAAALGCDAPQHDVAVDAISTDSRKVNFGTLFAALPGSRTDGHDFAPAAVKLGATALLVRRRLDLDVPQLVVEDVLLALGTLAALVRDRLDPVVVGITGSNGKTTVKEMVASILKLKGEVLATQGNYNNELGVPLSIFGLQPKHRFAVLELGASKSGDIAYLSRIARPDVALVNNVGPAHLGGFGSLEGVARAKGEIYAGLPADGWAVLNADEPWLDLWRGVNTAGHSLTFGKAEASDVQVLESPEAARFRTPGGTFEARLALPGRHNHFNAAAAVAIALALGVDIDTIREGLEAVQPVKGRLNTLKTPGGWTVVDDTYNANPASLYSALQVLSEMQGGAWLVLGDMKELGEDSRKLHWEVGEAARAMGVRRLFTIGDLAKITAEAFGEGAEHFETRKALAHALLRALRPGINCLVKGSRSMGMEAVVEAITHPDAMREAC